MVPRIGWMADCMVSLTVLVGGTAGLVRLVLMEG